MNLIKSILKKLLFLALIVAFFMFGGYSFTKTKINEYRNPPREIFIEKEKNFADFSNVSSDYQLYRSFNFFGYKKLTQNTYQLVKK